MRESEFRTVEQELANLAATKPALGSPDHQRLQLLRHRAELLKADQMGAPLPDSSEYLKLLEQVFGLSLLLHVLASSPWFN